MNYWQNCLTKYHPWALQISIAYNVEEQLISCMQCSGFIYQHNMYEEVLNKFTLFITEN